jgi:protease-4
MIRFLFLLALLPLLANLSACRLARPIQSVVQGNMTMDGDMNMDGDMRMDGAMKMDGDMRMSGEVSTVMRSDHTASRLASVPVYAPAGPRPNGAGVIAIVDVDGLLINKNIGGIGALGENPVALFREKLDSLAADPTVAAIVLRINSPGGGVTAADIMARDLLQLKQTRNLPVVACLMDVGTGAGYYLACTADAIVAHPTSIVGGIGVILNAYNMEVAIEQFSIASIPIKAGERIDIASPEREMELEERALLQDMADEFHQRFQDHVRRLRPAMRETQVFDGRVVTGVTARDWGLVDQLGYLDDAVVRARQLAQLPDDAPLVMLRRDNDRAHTLLDITPIAPSMSSLLPFKFPGLDRSSLPTFMYLWQPEPTLVSSSGG